jgi:nucleoside-diphosphate-sugar epimerase
MNKKILITGSNGFIGSNIKKYLEKFPISVTSISRKDFDLSSYESTKRWFDTTNQNFDTVIHTAIQGGSRLKEDDGSVIDNNIRMYYNLLSNNKYFNKFINLSSGAEYSQKDTPYGLSKKIISESIKYKINYFNLRIYAVFNEHEINTRFIKNSINNYINHKNITIFKNRLMDFMYMDDFLSLLYKYIYDSNLPKDIDCVYNKKYSLVDIANIINNLDIYKNNIEILDTKLGDDYIGKFTDLNINYLGLENGIKQTYSKLERQHETN